MEKDEKRLTEHFRMDEFVYSAMAVELGLNNALPSEVIPAIRNLTVHTPTTYEKYRSFSIK